MGPELILLVIVLVVVLAWRGPSNLPRLGEAMGKAVRNVRDAMPSGSKGSSEGGASGDGQAGAPGGGQAGRDDAGSDDSQRLP